MSLRLEIDGTEYEYFKSASATIRLDALANNFSFECIDSNFVGGEKCRVIVDNIPVVTGWIEILSGNYSADEHSVFIEGRDLTADLLDSTISELSDINTPISLKQIIEKVLKHIGLNILVIDNVNPKIFGTFDNVAAPEPGDNAFSFLEPFARNRQVLLTSDGDGNIVIEKTPGEDTGAVLQNIKGESGNNVLTAGWSKDQTVRYNKYVFESSLNPVSLLKANTTALDKLVSQSGQLIDSEIRTSRQLAVVAESPFSNVENSDRALWEARIRKTRGRMYSATVQGFKHSGGDLWQPNQLVTVVDDFAKINEKMLINSVTYNLDENGSTTTLTCVSKNGYLLDLQDSTDAELGGLF